MTGSGLNQELSLIRPGDTRWNSHYKTLMRLIDMFPSIVNVLEYIVKECPNEPSQRQADGILEYFETFEFVFYLHLMFHILGITDTLSRILQKKDQEMVEAVSMVESTKTVLHNFRESGFDKVLAKVSKFCGKHDIQMLDMKKDYVSSRSRNQRNKITNQHYFKVDCFNVIMDKLHQEFGDRFNEVDMELLKNMAALSPRDSFSQFNASTLLRLSELYPYDFDDREKIKLEHQLSLYHQSVLKDTNFANLKTIADLSKMMVKTRKHLSYHLVYRLLKLALVLPVATASVEISFSAMKRIKSSLRNRISDDFLNACVICAVEVDKLVNVTNEDVIERFQKMKTRRGQL
ncbi:uncharacterized protein LOC143568566 [Bidens hawaiensis]|uniref:uncharacterized protein LOC143568566 n=1 Tax=Bidens hawaiensis TaxID=980011 RepID=UPI0040494299